MEKKRHLLFGAAMLIACVVSAQETAKMVDSNVDTTLQFVDSEGNVVEDGATINGVAEYVDLGGVLGGYYQISTGLSVRNNAGEEVGARISGEITRMDSGSLSCCFPKNCASQTTVGSFYTMPGTMGANETRLFTTEWLPREYGMCTATFRIQIMDIVYNSFGIPMDYTLKADGPSVSVNFVYDSSVTDIAGVEVNEDVTEVARYSVDGRLLSSPQSGINIVKYSNGKTAKIIVK